MPARAARAADWIRRHARLPLHRRAGGRAGDSDDGLAGWLVLRAGPGSGGQVERGTGGEEVVEVEEVGWARGAGQQAGGLSPLLPLPSLSLSRHTSPNPRCFYALSPLALTLSLSHQLW